MIGQLERLNALLVYVPRWHACVLGPVPFGQTDRVHLALDDVVVETRDEAEARLWSFVEDACETWRVPFVLDEWELLHVVMLGGN